MRMRFTLVVPALVAIATVALATREAAAQAGRSSFGNNSYSGSRSGYQGSQLGSQLPFSSGSSRGFGQSSFGSGGFGQGGMGQGGFGRGGFGQNSGGGMGAGSQGIGGQGPLQGALTQSAGEQFQQNGFVGRDAQDVQTSFDNQNRRGPGQMMDQMIENLNEMREARRRWREQNSAPPPIRVRLQPAFDLPARPPAQAATEVQTRLTQAMTARGVASPQVEMAGRVALLRGVVVSERDRALLERLALLEPGVSKVENFLTIQTTAAPPQR
jgi:osmotically-inducible protein OsmY